MRTRLSALIAGVMMTTACAEKSTTPVEPSAPTLAVAASESAGDFDDEFVRIAKEAIPGFAGYHLDKDSNLVISLATAESATLAPEYFAREKDRLQIPQHRATIINRVRYDFPTLKAWFELVAPVLSDGVEMLDIDEVGNQLFVGVTRKANSRQIVSDITKLGIPPEGVRVEVIGETAQRTDLKDFWRPLAGGLQIHTPDIPGSSGI